MTSPQPARAKSSTRSSGEEEKHESEGTEHSEPTPQHVVPLPGVSTGAAANGNGSSSTSDRREDEKAESEGAETAEEVPRRKRGFDARAAMIFQNWRQSSGEAGAERRQATNEELSGLGEAKAVSGFGARAQLDQHLLERTGRARPRPDEQRTSELGALEEKKPVSGFGGRERFERHLLERTGRARFGPGEQVAGELQGLRDKGRVGNLKKVLGPEHAFTKAIGERKERGPDFDPEAHVVEKRRVREEQKKAKGQIEEKLGPLKKEIAAARELEGTEGASTDLADYDRLSGLQDWIGALAALGRVEALSKEALGNAEEAAGALRPLAERVAKAPACLQPPGWKDARAALNDAYRAKRWLTIGRDVGMYRSSLEQAIGFIDRVAEVRRRTELLKNPTQASNMQTFLGELEKMSWDKVVATQNSTSEKGAIAYLEDRLNRYEGNAAAAEKAIAEAKRKQDEGLIGSNGREIKEKKVDDFAGEEKTAIENSLTAYDGGTVPVLSHPNGMQWAALHKNRDGHLPGAADAGGYKEYYVEKKPGSATYHGNRRLVVHNKSKRVYYSWTHYGDNGSPAFVRIR